MGSQAIPLWLYVLLPMLSTFVSAVGIYGVWVRAHFKGRRERDDRLDASATAVLGQPGDWRRGQHQVVGLVDQLPQLQETVQRLATQVGYSNGSGKTVMQAIEEIKQAISGIDRRMSDHFVLDQQRFDALEKTMSRHEKSHG